MKDLYVEKNLQAGLFAASVIFPTLNTENQAIIFGAAFSISCNDC
jgi:hypothetical protein